ncbi:hypothetical protein D3C72_2372380 [compost metagenome]
MPLVVAGQAHDDRQPAGFSQHRVQHGQLLGVVQRGGLARAAAHDQPVHARRGIVAHQSAQCAAVNGAASKWGNQGHPDALEHRLLNRHENTPSM